MDKWKFAEVRGTLYSLILKVDALAAECSKLADVQDHLEEALSFLEDIQEV